MSSQLSQPIKLIAVWTFIVVGGLVTASVAFVAIVSICEGFTHVHRSGSWVPIVAGTLVFGLISWMYLRAAKAISGRLTSDERLNL